MRFDSRIAATRQVSAALELDAGSYVLIPYTAEPLSLLPFSIVAGATSEVSLAELPVSRDNEPITLRGVWSLASSTAGGCPNDVDTWTQNPHFLVQADGPFTAVGVLTLELDVADAQQMEVTKNQIRPNRHPQNLSSSTAPTLNNLSLRITHNPTLILDLAFNQESVAEHTHAAQMAQMRGDAAEEAQAQVRLTEPNYHPSCTITITATQPPRLPLTLIPPRLPLTLILAVSIRRGSRVLRPRSASSSCAPLTGGRYRALVSCRHPKSCAPRLTCTARKR